MKKLLLLLCCLLTTSAFGQGSFHFINSKKHSFKFDLNSDLVFIPVQVNGVELMFLLDSGVKETILFVSDKDSIPLENVTKVTFSGIGIEEGVEGLLSMHNEINVGEIVADFAHNLYVINAEELDVSKHVGFPVHGIMGSRLFERFVVEIDYQKRKISLYDHIHQVKPSIKKYKKVPISLERNRPYVLANLDFGNRKLEQAKMLIDLGNSDGLLVFPFLLKDFEVNHPNIYDYIGRGFNGEIFGHRNRIAGFDFAGYAIKEPVVSYPDSIAVHSAKLTENRIGSIGNQVLQTFNLIFNYQDSVIYLKPNKKFGRPFLVNLTGMEVRHDGMVWTHKRITAHVNSVGTARNQAYSGTSVTLGETFRYEFKLLPNYVISTIRKDSPADLAGIKQGDILLKINNQYASDLSLSDIIGKFRDPSHGDLKVLVKRADQEISLFIKLKDPIPYQKPK